MSSVLGGKRVCVQYNIVAVIKKQGQLYYPCFNPYKTQCKCVPLVRDVRLELTRSPTRPLNVRVCPFRQSRILPNYNN